MTVDLDSSPDQLPLFSLEVAFSRPDPVATVSSPVRNVYLVYSNVQDTAAYRSPLGPSVPVKPVQLDVKAQLLRRVSLF